MSELANDLRLALRRLAQRPGFSLVALLTLTLGIGATTAIFTVVRSVLLEPLPYPEADRLLVIQEKNPAAGFPRFSISPLNFRDYRAMSTSFEAMAARTSNRLSLASDDGPARSLRGQAVTADYLEVLRMPPALGRDFNEEDDRPGAEPVVILTHGVWRDLGSDPQLVGAKLRIDGRPTTVIGVLPASYPDKVEALVPLAHDYEKSSRGAHWLVAFGRLKPEVSVETARGELEQVAANLEASYPASNTGWSALVTPLHERLVENVETALWVLLAAVGLVLLIACANVANLTLARLAAREREVALRSALGAGRWRLLREQLAESLVLALAAGGLGVWLAAQATRWLVALNRDDIPRATEIAVDGGVLLFALAAALGSVLLFGFLPALQASRGDLAGVLKEGGRGQAGGRRGERLRLSLVLGEVALALMLLVGAGLLIKSFGKLLGVEPGFMPERIWVADLSLPAASYAEPAQRQAFYRRLLEEAKALPGVEHASTVMPMPLSGNNMVFETFLEGEPIPEPNHEHNVNAAFVSPGYFDAMAIPILRGRDFSLADSGEAAAVIVVSQSAAEKFWPEQEALGKRISFSSPAEEDVEWLTVVGIVGDVHQASLDATVQPTFYVPTLSDDPPDYATVVLRAAGDPAALAGPLRALVSRLDPDLPLAGEQTGGDLLASSVATPRFNTALLSTFAGLALVLAAIGVFGVVSYTVTQHLREFGVRAALGAGRGQIVALVLAKGLRPVAAGIVLGLAGALAASRLLASLVYGVGLADPMTYLLVGLLLAGAAALACLIPALRATRVDPVEVLRAE